LKVYRPTGQLLADVECLLAANRPDAHHSPLEDVIDLLCRGRHYAWAGVFLAVADGATQPAMAAGSLGELTLPETRSKLLVTMTSASRELGVLSVESDRENAFGTQDRVLLEAVADTLARFLAGNGKYLVRRAKTENREPRTNN
jgi:GAF domain-containing protein